MSTVGCRTAAGLAVSLALGAASQSHGAASVAETVAFDIDAPSMAQALMQFTVQSGLQLAFPTDGTADLPARRVVGRYTPSAALQVLLADSGLKYEFANERTVAIRVDDAGAAARSGAPPQHAAAARTIGLADAADPSSGTGAQDIGGAQLRKGIPEVLIKGSRALNMDIQRSRDDVQPYIVFDRSAIEQSSAANVEDFLRMRLGAQSSSLANAQSLGSGNTSSYVDLRGLGSNQTLILIDGRRAAPLNAFAGTNQPDINGIPLSAIERIEVLPATASGIYGGGATGGVVNIVLRRNYSGFETTLTYGDSFNGGGGTRRADVAGAFQLEGGRTNVTLAGSYSDSTDLLWADRDLLQRSRERAVANNPGSVFVVGSPPILGATTNITTLDGSDLSLKSQYGGASARSPITYVPYGYQGAASDNGAGLLANAGRYNTDLANTAQYGGGHQSVLSTPTVKSLATSLRRSFTSRVDGFLELSASENAGRAITNSNAGAFFLAGSDAANPFDQDILITTPIFDADLTASTEHRNYRAVAGAIVDLTANWRAELDYTWSRSRTRVRYTDALTNSAADTAVSNGVTNEGSTFDVFRDTNGSGISFEQFLTAPTSRSPLVLTMHDAAVRLGGPLEWSLPAGKPTVSVLVEYRREALDEVTSITPTSQSIAYARGQNVRSVYFETVIPLLAARSPSQDARLLDLQLAVRRDEYRITGSNFGFEIAGVVEAQPRTSLTRKLSSVDPTISLRLQPVRDIAFRTTYSTGFLPPAMNQLVPDAPVTFGLPYYTDPRRGNEPLGDVVATTGGNPALRPEESKSWSAGFILKPAALAGLRLSADWVHIKKTDNIVSLGLTQDNINNERLYPGVITRGPASDGFEVGPIIGFNTQPINLAEQTVEAVDIALDYRRPFGGSGNVSVSLAATRNLHNSSRASAESTPLESLHSINVLPWQGYVDLAWERSAWTVQWVSRYFDSYCLLTGCATGPITVSQGSVSVPSQLYHDLSVRYRFGAAAAGTLLEDTELRVGATNIFNKRPPVDFGTLAFYSTYGDPRLATYSLSVRKTF